MRLEWREKSLPEEGEEKSGDGLRGQTRERAREEPAPVAGEGRKEEVGKTFEEGTLVPCHQVPLEVLRKRLPVEASGTYWGQSGGISGLVQGVHVRSKEDVEVEVVVQGTNLPGTHLEVGLRVRRQGDENPHVRGEVRRPHRSRQLPPRRVHSCQDRRRPAVDDEPGSRGRRKEEGAIRETSYRRGEERGEREEERKGSRKKQREGPQSKAEEAQEQWERFKGGQREEEDLLERGGQEGAEGRVRRHRGRSRPPLPPKVRSQGSQKGEEKGEGYLLRHQFRLQARGQQREERGAVWRGAEDSPNGASSARGVDLCCLPRHPELPVDRNGGVWNPEEGVIPPIACQYYRQCMQQRLQGGQAWEALTVAWTLDVLLQGRVSEACDTLTQRFKSLEMSGAGASWAISQKVVPPEKPVLSSRPEMREAIRENREEQKTRSEAARPKGKGDSGSSSWREEDRGKGREAKGKGKKGKEKGEGKRAEK